MEPDDHLRGLAARSAESAPVRVRVLAGHAAALPVEDAGFDAVVASLVLCSVPDQRVALGEMRRVLKPDGRLRFFEHVRSQSPWLGLLEDAVTPLWSRIGGGCHLNRDTTDAIRAAGFDTETLDRFSFAPLKYFPPFAHILGQARPTPTRLGS